MVMQKGASKVVCVRQHTDVVLEYATILLYCALGPCMQAAGCVRWTLRDQSIHVPHAGWHRLDAGLPFQSSVLGRCWRQHLLACDGQVNRCEMPCTGQAACCEELLGMLSRCMAHIFPLPDYSSHVREESVCDTRSAEGNVAPHGWAQFEAKDGRRSSWLPSRAAFVQTPCILYERADSNIRGSRARFLCTCRQCCHPLDGERQHASTLKRAPLSVWDQLDRVYEVSECGCTAFEQSCVSGCVDVPCVRS
jgi:hypothetical protein